MARIIWDSTAPWSTSGYGTQTAIWTRKLQEMGHEVIISTYFGLAGSPMEWNGLPVLPGFGGAYCSPSLEQHCKHADPDLVITLGDIWVKDPGVLAKLPAALWLPADCRPMSTADRNVAEAGGTRLIAMSRFGEARFKAAGFSQVLYVPHALDLEVWQPPQDRQALREAAGIGPDTFMIGCNAANNDAIRKAAPELMLAFARFLKDRPDSMLALHTGIHQDGGQDLECVAENLGITDKVKVVDQYRYTAGLISQEHLRDWYGTIDVLSSASFGEGFGLPIIEAQACSTPVITTRCSSMEELNPLGWQVDGEPFWNGVHRAWWIRPSVRGLYEAFHKAWDARGDVDRAALRQFVADGYEVGVVADRHMKPVIDELLDYMAVKRGKAVAA